MYPSRLLNPHPPKVKLGRRFLRVLWFSALSIIPPLHHCYTWFTYHRRYTNFVNDSASWNTHSYHRRPFSSILAKFNNTNKRADNSKPVCLFCHSLLFVVVAGGPPCHGAYLTPLLYSRWHDFFIAVDDAAEPRFTQMMLIMFLIIVFQQDATYSVYYFSVGSSTCFGCWHASSGARTTDTHPDYGCQHPKHVELPTKM